jgi:hypothetical protein
VFVPLLLEGVRDGITVRADCEVECFQHVAVMLHGIANSHQPSILGAVFLLRRVELLGKECKELPGVVDTLLNNSTHGGSL